MRYRPAFEERLNSRIAHLRLLQIVLVAMVFVNPISRSACGHGSQSWTGLSDSWHQAPSKGVLERPSPKALLSVVLLVVALVFCTVVHDVQ